MKILAVCRSGRVRSHAIKVAMELKGHEAINAGVKYHSPETLKMLAEWAELILVPEAWIKEELESMGITTRIIDLQIGPDIWKTKVTQDLMKVTQKKIKKHVKIIYFDDMDTPTSSVQNNALNWVLERKINKRSLI